MIEAVTYSAIRKFNADAAKRAPDGWTVAAVSQGSGIYRNRMIVVWQNLGR